LLSLKGFYSAKASLPDSLKSTTDKFAFILLNKSSELQYFLLMKKVLIITYYWPPSGGPGVQRILKFVKYLPLFGWEPVILTVENGNYPSIDNTLLAEIPKDLEYIKQNLSSRLSCIRKLQASLQKKNTDICIEQVREGKHRRKIIAMDES
jgi:hypothetical protein